MEMLLMAVLVVLVVRDSPSAWKGGASSRLLGSAPLHVFGPMVIGR
jgi:hypothetical protein